MQIGKGKLMQIARLRGLGVSMGTLLKCVEEIHEAQDDVHGTIGDGLCLQVYVKELGYDNEVRPGSNLAGVSNSVASTEDGEASDV